MDIKEALTAMQNLGVSLNDYDSEALNEICNFVHDAISISNGLPPLARTRQDYVAIRG